MTVERMMEGHGERISEGRGAWSCMFDWAYTGVDFTLAGNGGKDCVNFLSIKQRIIECILVSLFSCYLIKRAISKLTLPHQDIPQIGQKSHLGKQILLVIMCLTFGIELGFKLSTRQMIYLLNPCHIVTMMQIFLLAAPPSRMVTATFRLHLNMLTGAPIAILFPVINTRLLPFETEIYFIQHILIMIIPLYLLRSGGVYIPEPLWDFSWASLSVGVLFLYHFIPLQYLAMISYVNLNNMLCPAISDPFYGQWYHVCAIGHQTLAIPFIGKAYTFIMKRLDILQNSNREVYMLRKVMSKVRSEECMKKENLMGNGKHLERNATLCNGHVKTS